MRARSGPGNCSGSLTGAAGRPRLPTASFNLGENGLPRHLHQHTRGQGGALSQWVVYRNMGHSGEEDDAESVEDAFTQARDTEGRLGGVPGRRLVEGVRGAAGTGQAYRNSNGRRAGEPDEGQLSLFSWAEFRTEGPVKRNDKPHSASTSGIQTRTECVHSHSTKPTSRVLDADAGFAATERLGDLFGSRAAISVQTGDQPRAGQRKTLVTTTAGKRRSHAEIGGIREVMVAQEAQLEKLGRWLTKLEKDGRSAPEPSGKEREPAEWHPPNRAYGLPDPGVVTLKPQTDAAHALGSAAALVAGRRHLRIGGAETGTGSKAPGRRSAGGSSRLR